MYETDLALLPNHPSKLGKGFVDKTDIEAIYRKIGYKCKAMTEYGTVPPFLLSMHVDNPITERLRRFPLPALTWLYYPANLAGISEAADVIWENDEGELIRLRRRPLCKQMVLMAERAGAGCSRACAPHRPCEGAPQPHAPAAVAGVVRRAPGQAGRAKRYPRQARRGFGCFSSETFAVPSAGRLRAR